MSDSESAISNSPAPPASLPDSQGRELYTHELSYTPALPEYPKTDADGFTYVIRVRPEKRGSKKDAFDIIEHDTDKEVNRSNIPKHDPKHLEYSGPFKLFHSDVKHFKYKCTSLKACENLTQRLRLTHHTEVTVELWRDIRMIQGDVDLVETNQSRRNAYSIEPEIDGSKPTLRRINYDAPRSLRHYFHPALRHAQLDVDFLERIFNEGLLPPTEEFFLIYSYHFAKTGFDPPSGRGRLIKLGSDSPCPLVFHVLVPLHLEACPYLTFTSEGIHNHPPPPPNKAPGEFLKSLAEEVQNMNQPDLTLATFLKSPQLQDFATNTIRVRCQESTLVPRTWIVCCNSSQQWYQGILFELERNPAIKDYVQQIHQDAEDLMIVCILKEQAELLLDMDFLEVDMSYKRIGKSDLNEVVFATFLHGHGKIITLCRVFTEQEDPAGYCRLFQRAFEVVSQLTGKQVRFRHIHGGGINDLGLDMDTKQTKGLGLYLESIDPKGVALAAIYCRVHFLRNIEQAVGKRKAQEVSLLDCQSNFTYVNCLSRESNPKVIDLVRHKRNPDIACGLNKFCSLIPVDMFEKLRNYTNAAEQTHNKSHAFGRRQTLLQGVVSSTYGISTNGIRHAYARTTWRPIIPETRRRRRDERANQTPLLPDNDSGDFDLPVPPTVDPEASRVASDPGLLLLSLRKTSKTLELRRQETELERLQEDLRRDRLDNDAKEIENDEKRLAMRREGLKTSVSNSFCNVRKAI
ncbi:hypothetical protein V8E54_014755 [Elaphomyces granulatus]